MHGVKSVLCHNFNKLPPPPPPNISESFVSKRSSLSYPLCNCSGYVHKACFLKGTSCLRKASNLIKTIRKSDFSGNASNSLHMLLYFCTAIVCSCELHLRPNDNAVFFSSPYNSTLVIMFISIGHHWTVKEKSGGCKESALLVKSKLCFSVS